MVQSFTISQTGSCGCNTVVGFNGKGIITGGGGKFKHAVGEFEFSGYFNMLDANDAEFDMKGWISF